VKKGLRLWWGRAKRMDDLVGVEERLELGWVEWRRHLGWLGEEDKGEFLDEN